MAVRRFVVDSGGTSRLITRRFVVDSGGTSRLIKRRFVIDSGGVARLVYQGIAQPQNLIITCGDFNFGEASGFDNSPAAFNLSIGSIAPNTFGDSTPTTRTVISAHRDNLGPLFNLLLSGTSIPDTDVTFQRIIVNGTTLTRSSRSTYNGSFGGGTLWQWSSGLPSVPTSGDITMRVLFEAGQS
jgi:hypothetical protein